MVEQLFKALRGQKTILLVEHDMDAVSRSQIASPCWSMAASSPPGMREEIRSNPEVRRAYLGEEAA